MTSRHFTTRRGFIAAASLGVVSLYGLWAAFDAAPTGFGRHDDHPAEPKGGGGHGGHGDAKGPSPDEFRRMTEEFAERYKLPDGSVKPMRADPHAAHAGHVASAMALAGAEPIDVYLMAYQWAFEPSLLRLEAKVPYRFRMMAIDVSHGASLQLGTASRIVRLRRGSLVEQMLTFERTGEVLVYCTVYCGVPHDRMAAKIIVA